MINDDKRVLEHFNNLLDNTKDKEKITVNRQNIVYLVNKLEKYFKQAERVEGLEKENKLLRFIAEENKIAHEQRVEQNKRYRELIEQVLCEMESDMEYFGDRRYGEWYSFTRYDEVRGWYDFIEERYKALKHIEELIGE